MKATWTWLAANTTGTGKSKRIDFGINAFDALLPTDPEERRALLGSLCAPSNRAPVMMPAHVDDFVQTTVPPVPDPNPELFLHGKGDRPADVTVVWRADLSAELLADSRVSRRTVALVPPVSMEGLPLPVWHVRKWLQRRMGSGAADFSDVEGELAPPERGRSNRESDPFLVWNGPDAEGGTVVSRDPGDVRPGGTIVVPSTYGGCDSFGWNPDHHAAVIDVADDCSWRAKRRPVLRVNAAGTHRALLLGSGGASAVWASLLDAGLRQEISTRLDELLPDPEPVIPDWSALGELRRRLPETFAWVMPRRNKPPVWYPGSEEGGFVVVGPVAHLHPDDRNVDVDLPDDGPAGGDGESFPGGLVPLESHCAGVRKWVERFADRLGLTEWSESLSRAALLHDAGKADPRFQEWLFGNPVEAAKATQPIAKSGIDGRDAAAVDRTRRQAGWPKHARHEAMSVLLVQGNTAAMQGIPDPELLVHLIATHHGRGRPLWPITLDDELPDGTSVPERVECRLPGFALHAIGERRPEEKLTPFHAGWVDHFRRMVTKYGYWGLAYLEMLLVLADHRQSEAEREVDE